MSNSRARVDFPRTEQGLVDKFMGTAYDRMLEVYEHVDAFEALYEVLLEIEDVATYVANKKVDAAIKEMVAYLQDLELRMVERIKEEGDKYTNKFDEYVKYIEDLVNNIRTDFIVQETGKGLDVAMSQDATTRELNKKWDIQKTQGKGDLIRYSLLKEVEDNAKNEYDNIYTVINRVDEKRITSEKELKVEIADSKSSISRVEDVMVTEFRAQAEVNTKIESSLGDAKGSIITIEKTMADNNKAQASKNELLESSIRGNTASISNLSETVASDREVSASQVNELKAEVRDSKSSITALDTVVANDRKAIANQFNELESTIGSNTASITSLSETVSTNHQVSVNQYNTLKGEVDQNFGLIEDLNEIVVTDKDATAQKIVELKAEVGDNSAEISKIDQVVANIDGEVSAMTKMTTTTTSNGIKVVTGLQFGSDGTTSDFKVMADNFTVVSIDGLSETQMFTAKKVGDKTEFVVNGKVRADQVDAGKLIGMELEGGSLDIGNGNLTVDKKGNLYSKNGKIVGGTLEGALIKAGDFIGGAIDIGEGNFVVDKDGNITAKNGSFGGTIQADKIEGDIATISRFERTREASEHSFTIPAENFSRLLIINSLELYDLRMPTSVGAMNTIMLYVYINDSEVYRKNDLTNTYTVPEIQKVIPVGTPITVKIVVKGDWENTAHIFGFSKIRNCLVTATKTKNL